MLGSCVTGTAQLLYVSCSHAGGYYSQLMPLVSDAFACFLAASVPCGLVPSLGLRLGSPWAPLRLVALSGLLVDRLLGE